MYLTCTLFSSPPVLFPCSLHLLFFFTFLLFLCLFCFPFHTVYIFLFLFFFFFSFHPLFFSLLFFFHPLRESWSVLSTWPAALRTCRPPSWAFSVGTTLAKPSSRPETTPPSSTTQPHTHTPRHYAVNPPITMPMWQTVLATNQTIWNLRAAKVVGSPCWCKPSHAMPQPVTISGNFFNWTAAVCWWTWWRLEGTDFLPHLSCCVITNMALIVRVCVHVYLPHLMAASKLCVTERALGTNYINQPKGKHFSNSLLQTFCMCHTNTPPSDARLVVCWTLKQSYLTTRGVCSW